MVDLAHVFPKCGSQESNRMGFAIYARNTIQNANRRIPLASSPAKYCTHGPKSVSKAPTVPNPTNHHWNDGALPHTAYCTSPIIYPSTALKQTRLMGTPHYQIESVS